ncbi:MULTISPECIES: MCE family protein [unclassified Nocardioides]|uniref:MCE family protein n=1 Tax=unclassified Nocardioides TaxID=2615069 RepID=UPI00070078F5|nr:MULTISPECIES: MCE family protein [unclassified Nocardioides]KRA31085.1 hypothetical protein ASD81_16500 [Nocardioides sp. Root614]KRA87705.1 hypothetical protein ASD84_16770 [Nocardioides sp. Root682]
MMWTTKRTRRTTIQLAALAIMVSLSGCGYENLNSLTLPGTTGTGDDSYTLTIRVPNALNVVPNSPVRVGDLEVGTIRKVELDGVQPVITISVRDDVQLPENVTARIGQTSLFGAKHIELLAPAPEVAQGSLSDGDVVELANAGAYPTTEDVLSSVAALLNGGGLAQIKTITTELNRALGGREGTTRQALAQTEQFVTGLDRQRDEISRAIDSLDGFARDFKKGNKTIARALETFPDALDVLSKERERLIAMLEALGRFGDQTTRFINRGGANLTQNIASLEPALKALANAGTSLTDSLYLLGTVTFPIRTMDEYIRGDYVNLFATLDLRLESLDKALLTGTPLQGILTSASGLLGQTIGLGGTAGNPLTDPIKVTEPLVPTDPSAGAAGEKPGATKGESTTPEKAPAPNGNVGTGLLDLLSGLLGQKAGG